MNGDRITARQQWTGLLFASPYLIGVCVFLLVPLAMALYYSFCHYTMLQEPIWTGWENYRKLLSDEIFIASLKNTIIYAACSLPLTLGASVLLAVLLNQPVRSQAMYRTIIFLPSLVPAVATAMLWQWLYNAKFGLINNMLKGPLHGIGMMLAAIAKVFGAGGESVRGLQHLSPPNWLGDAQWAMAALIFLSVWGIGQTVVIFLAGLQDIPRELYEAAEIDGARGPGRFFHVTLPMLSPVIFFNLIMGIIGSWQVFDVPYVMTGGGPNRATTFYSMYLFNAAFMEQRMGAASAMAWIQFLIILLLTGLAFWSSKRWVHYA